MFSDAKIRALRARGTARLMTTEAAVKELGLSKQRWLRLSRCTGFPKRYRVGRVWCINPVALADFLEHHNALEAGLSLSGVAKALHITHYTALGLYERGELPKPLGFIHARPRWSADSIEETRLARLGGAQPPPGVYEGKGPARAAAHA